MKSKILLVHTGGTIGMIREKGSGVLKPDRFYEHLLRFIPELSTIADIRVEIPFILDSSQMHASHWQTLARLVAGAAAEVDGVVVLQGTDTLAYSASALSFMLGNTPIPVVLTGAQRPLAELRTDARSNLVNAVEIATRGVKEVSVFFDYHLMRGNRTTKSHASRFDAFSSPNYPLLAEVGIDIVIFWQNVRYAQGEFQLRDRLDPSLAVLRLFPGCEANHFRPGEDVRAVIIIGFGSGTVPLPTDSLLRSVEEWIASGKVVVLCSEAKGGKVDPELYESGGRLSRLGVLSTADMTFEAVVAKLMFLLGQYEKSEDVRRRFLENLAGELGLPPAASPGAS